MQTAVKTKKPRKQAVSGCFWANRTYRGRIKDDHKIDPFGGSGTTLIACENLNRKCRMVEYDPHYCDVIIERWETLTGQKAVLLDE